MYPLNTYKAYDFHITRGEDLVLNIAITNPDGTVKPLTGATVVFVIGDIRADEVTLEIPATLIDGGIGGIVQVPLTDSDTLSMSSRSYDYQCIATDSAGKTQVVKRGLMYVYPILQG